MEKQYLENLGLKELDDSELLETEGGWILFAVFLAGVALGLWFSSNGNSYSAPETE